MLAADTLHPTSPTIAGRSRALVLSALVHGLFAAAWILAPQPAWHDLGSGPLSVELQLEPPPPPAEPEAQPAPPQPPARSEPQPEIKPKPAPPRPPTKQAAPAKPITSAPAPAAEATAAPEAAASAPAATANSEPVTTGAPSPALISSPDSQSVAVGAPAGRNAEQDDYTRIVWTRIMRYRPDRVQYTGLTRLRFILDQQGDLISVEVAESSGNSALDRAALAAVRRAAPFPQPPNTMPASALNFEIPFRFR